MTAIHPFQVMPPLTEEERQALREDIAANGVLVPITVDQHENIIDGHHRQQIADELGIPCPRAVQEFANDEERHNVALALNLKRRHLTREQMRELIVTECERTSEASDREIARRLGCSHRTVAAARRPVDNLSTPIATREEAEERFHQIRHGLDQIDQMCIDLLADGTPPTMVAEMLIRISTEAAEHFDAEINDAMWRHMVAPRVTFILGWQSSTVPS
jgi:ParB-like chromosome segregation protein Spo0J